MTTAHNVLARLRKNLARNRLGELLVSRGEITPAQLHEALKRQNATGTALGKVLQDMGLITGLTLRTTLVQQMTYRAVAACLAFSIGFSSFGSHTAGATSASLRMENPRAIVKSLPEGRLEQVALHPNTPIAPLDAYPSLFGSNEVRSGDISAFTKWTGVLTRLTAGTHGAWRGQIEAYRGEDLAQMAAHIDQFFNRIPYVEDKQNWGVSDYWATPDEFVARNAGDCEDFAVAKYAALKQLGVPEERMRLAIVQDMVKGIPHAILIVYTDKGAMLLDNQSRVSKMAVSVSKYRPIYSINASGWWRHLG